LQATLSEVQYDAEKVDSWTNAVIDSCLKGLQGLGKPFKYIGASVARPMRGPCVLGHL
jgi:hypothetical protein